jgi:predicted nucleotidyltransferase
MKTLEEIELALGRCKHLIQEKYQITDIGIFGSYARGEQTEESDIDILVDYEEAPSFLELANLENYLSEVLAAKVDLVTKNGMKPRIKSRVLSETVFV